jgi:hypothetical protein
MDFRLLLALLSPTANLGVEAVDLTTWLPGCNIKPAQIKAIPSSFKGNSLVPRLNLNCIGLLWYIVLPNLWFSSRLTRGPTATDGEEKGKNKGSFDPTNRRPRSVSADIESRQSGIYREPRFSLEIHALPLYLIGYDKSGNKLRRCSSHQDAEHPQETCHGPARRKRRLIWWNRRTPGCQLERDSVESSD